MTTEGDFALPKTIDGGSSLTSAQPSRPPAPLFGETPRQFGDYELLEEVARGGMGVVYKARQISLNRTVALKMILSGSLASSADVQRFLVEAQAAANLDHPNIVPIYEVGEQNGLHYFSMKLIDGAGLNKRVSAFLDNPRGAATLMANVAHAVHHAHQRGILHRDLKPGNILVDSQCEPHITDFGLAKRVDGDSKLTLSGVVMGTPAYMAPEQASGSKDLTVAADVYGLGAVLYELLTGKPPFQGATPLETIRQATDNDPPRPSSIRTGMEADLETICLKCLEKDPGRRYATAEALAEDLQRWLRGEPISARPSTAWERGRKWCRRRPAITALAVALVAVLLAGISGMTWEWRGAVVARKAVEQERIAALAAAEREARQAQQARAARDGEAEQRRAAVRLQKLAEQQRDAAGRYLYIAHMHLARESWEASDMPRLQEQLSESMPQPGGRDFRGWEWNYLEAQSHPQAVLRGHSTSAGGHATSITCLHWSLDGTRLASAAADANRLAEWGELKVWDASTGRELFAPGGRAGFGIHAVAWSPDGSRLASGGRSAGELKIRDAATGKEVLTLHGHAGHVNSIAWRGDGLQLASASGESGSPGELKIWDAITGKKLFDLVGHGDQVDSVSWSPGGQQLASACADGIIKIWDASNGTELRTLGADALAGLSGLVGQFVGPLRDEKNVPEHRQVFTAAWSSNGKYLASSSSDSPVKIWDPTTGKILQTLPIPTGVSLSWKSPDDELEIASADGTIRLWNMTESKITGAVKLTASGYTCAAWNPSRQRVALALKDQTINIVDLSAVSGAKLLDGGDKPVASVAWTADGRQFATTGAGVRIWDAITRTQRRLLSWPGDGFVLSAAWSPDGRHLAISGMMQLAGAIKIFDARAIKAHFTWNAHHGPAYAIAWSPDGHFLATAGYDKAIRIWDATAPDKELVTLEQTGKVYCIAWHPDQQHLASAGEDGSICVWDLAAPHAPAVVLQQGGMVKAVAWSRDGAQLASGGVNGIKIWDVAAAAELFTLHGHCGAVLSLSWRRDVQPERERLASVADDGTLKVWDVAAGQEVLTLRADKSGFLSVAWSPDGQQLVAGSSDGTVKVWGCPAGQE